MQFRNSIRFKKLSAPNDFMLTAKTKSIDSIYNYLTKSLNK